MSIISIVLSVMYVIIAIFLIAGYVKCIKRKFKWVILLFIEALLILITGFLLHFFNSMPGLSYIGEFIFSLVAMIVYGVFLGITLISSIIIYLLDKKKKGNNLFPEIGVIMALILMLVGLLFFALAISENMRIKKTKAVIIDYRDEEYWGKRPVVEYDVNNQKYQSVVHAYYKELEKNSAINGSISIYYYRNDPSKITFKSSYWIIYVPCFILALGIFTIVYRKNNH